MGVKRGALVVLEGIDGCGKSTQLKRLAATLEAAGHRVERTREPTAGAMGQRIRAMQRSGEAVPPEQELDWFQRDRAEHVEEVVLPALQAGRIVVSDRYFLSTVAYQGARGLDWQAILAESEARFPVPDLALILEVEVGAGLERARERGQAPHPRFENAAFLQRVAGVFAALDRPWIARVDGSGPPDTVEAALAAVVEARLGYAVRGADKDAPTPRPAR